MAQRSGRSVVIVLVALALVGLAYAVGLVNVDTSGDLKAPSIAITGGELPDIQVETAKINVGTRTETVDIPKVEVDVKARERTIDVPRIAVERADSDDPAATP